MIAKGSHVLLLPVQLLLFLLSPAETSIADGKLETCWHNLRGSGCLCGTARLPRCPLFFLFRCFVRQIVGSRLPFIPHVRWEVCLFLFYFLDLFDHR